MQMNRLTSLLTLALALQLLLAAALFWPRDNPGESNALDPLLALDTSAIDRLVISTDTESLLLRRADTGWIMPDYHKLPVQRSRLARALDDLPALARGWPVAGSDIAAERFEVSPEKYQRKVEYFSGDESRGAIYVGTSPGFRKVHVSPGDDGKVYAVEFNSFELPVMGGEWLDKSLLQLDEITAVEGLDYAIRRQGERWTGDAGEPSADEVDKLVNGLTSLRVTGAADIATASILADMTAPPTLTVDASGGSYEFRLYEIEDAFYVQRSDIPVFFSLGPFDYERLNEVSGQTLYAVEDDEADAGETTDNAGQSD